MEKATGRTVMNATERALILELRSKGYAFRQIAEFTKRSTSSVKRVVYGW